jgi:adhesin transport system membrane fusion protein
MTDLTNKGAGRRAGPGPTGRPGGADSLAARLSATADRVSLALIERLADRAAAATRPAPVARPDEAQPERPAETAFGPSAPAGSDPSARSTSAPAPPPAAPARRRFAGCAAAARRARATAPRAAPSRSAPARSAPAGSAPAGSDPSDRSSSASAAPPAAPDRPPFAGWAGAVRRARAGLSRPRTPSTAPVAPAPRPAAATPLPFGPPEEAPATPAAAIPPALTLEGQIERRAAGPSAIIWLTCAALAAFLGWAALAPVAEIVRAEGEFVSSSRPQIIQNLEGGILAELMVAEGDVVEPGDTLARLHGTAFRTSVDDLEDQIAALEIRRLRLEAEMAGLYDMDLPAALAARMPDIAASERALLAARQSDYVARTDGARAVLAQAEEERRILEDLWQERIVALIEVTRARKAHSDARARLDEIVAGAELERASAHSDTLKELASLRQQLRLSRDQLARTVLTSPLRGTVNKLTITTIGGVVRPGEEILQIVPLGEELFVEARVHPRDIGNVAVGQAATVKLTAYDYTIYGTLSGAVRFVSADTVRDAARPEAPPHYRVTVAVDRGALTGRQEGIAFRPGMQAQVELHTGEKTVLRYLTRPLNKAGEALREP